MSGDASQAPAFSEDALALRFSKRHADDLRYVAAWSKWLQWDGTRWAFDRTVNVYDLARAVCREAAAECNDNSSKRMASAVTRAAVENLARADRRHAAMVEDWDRDPWLLTTLGGTVDLRTGDIKPNNPADMTTKTTVVAPGVGCNRWLEFLRRITDGDDDLQIFLQRMAGYALTGLTREHALFFLYGLGANGKSVFLNTLAGLAGDYHVTAPMEVFITSHNDRHPTELAMLRGARLVTAVETEEGRRWAESRIKALTGGDPITARFMRQDFFEFTPVFKLMIAGNHKPALRSVDEAIRRRLHLIPFTVTIPEHERDETLPDKLKEEWPGILEWAIEGAVEWGMTGLQPPEAVREPGRYPRCVQADSAHPTAQATVPLMAHAATRAVVTWQGPGQPVMLELHGPDGEIAVPLLPKQALTLANELLTRGVQAIKADQWDDMYGQGAPQRAPDQGASR